MNDKKSIAIAAKNRRLSPKIAMERIKRKIEQNSKVQLPQYVIPFSTGDYKMRIIDYYPLRTQHGDKVVISFEGENLGLPFIEKKYFDGKKCIWSNSDLGKLLTELGAVDQTEYIHWDRLKDRIVTATIDKNKWGEFFIRKIVPLPIDEADDEDEAFSEDYDEDEAFSEDYDEEEDDEEE